MPATAVEFQPDLAPGILLARERLARRPAPFLWLEAGRRMAERLPLLRMQPELVLDVGCAWGDGLTMLRQQYAQARIVGLEPSPSLVAMAGKTHGRAEWWGSLLGRRRVDVVCAPLTIPPTIAAIESGASMLWSNLALSWAPDIQRVFSSWHQALLPDGVLMFTAFGPDTLRELHLPELRELGFRPPSYPDMHDLGDMLVHAGFSEPVMDMELVHLRYPSPQAALTELAELGRPPHVNAMSGLRTPRQWQALQDTLLRAAKLGEGGAVELTFELVYGHAFKPMTRAARGGVATFPVEQLRSFRKKR